MPRISRTPSNANSGDDEGGLYCHPISLAHREHQGVNQHKRVKGHQTALVKSMDQGIGTGTGRAYRRLRKEDTTESLGDSRDVACGNPLHHYFHERQDERLLAALAALK